MAVGLGTALRLWRLPGQVLVGDELHALHAALTSRFPEILYTYRTADASLPLASLSRLLLVLGVHLGEWHLRAPSLIAGVALVAIAPWWLLRRLGGWPALLLACLLALSPSLVLYSRIARPYMPATLLALLAVVLFERFLSQGRSTFAWAYGISSSLAVWFHPGVAPLVLAPLPVGAVALITRRKLVAAKWSGLGVAAAASAALLGLFLVPGSSSLLAVLHGKAGQGHFVADSSMAIFGLQAGSAYPAVVVLFWLVAMRGAAWLIRNETLIGLLSLVCVLSQVAALAILSPFAVGSPLVLARYLLPCLPFVLLWTATGLAAPGWRSARHGYATAWQKLGGGAFVLVLLLSTPLLGERYRYTSFMDAEDFIVFNRPRPRLTSDRSLDVYRRLRDGGVGAVIEFPGQLHDPRVCELCLFQDIHRRPERVSTPLPDLNDERFAFRNFVRPTLADFLSSNARFLVVHRDLAADVQRSTGIDAEQALAVKQPDLVAHFRDAAQALKSQLKRAWGPPQWSSDGIVCYDLDAVRKRMAARAPGNDVRGDS